MAQSERYLVPTNKSLSHSQLTANRKNAKTMKLFAEKKSMSCECSLLVNEGRWKSTINLPTTVVSFNLTAENSQCGRCGEIVDSGDQREWFRNDHSSRGSKKDLPSSYTVCVLSASDAESCKI